MKNKHRIQNCGEKKVGVQWKTRQKRLLERQRGLSEGWISHKPIRKRIHTIFFYPHTGNGKDHKNKDRKVFIHDQDFSLCKFRWRGTRLSLQNQAICILIVLTTLQRLRCTIQGTLFGLLQFFWKLPTIRHTLFWILNADDPWHSDTNCVPCNKSFVFANSETETCRKWHYSFSEKTSMFYQSWCVWDGRRACPLLPSSDEEFGYDLWTEFERRQNNMFCFVLYSSPVEHSTMGHIVLKFNLPCVPAKVAWAICSPNETFFVLTPQNSAYPIHSQELDDDEEDTFLSDVALRRVDTRICA